MTWHKQASEDPLDLKQLRTLLAIAESGSVTAAAEMLHIVQPAVSRQLRLLEEELGTPLFERGRRGMQLTQSGQILAGRARRALHELEQAKAEIVPVTGDVSGMVIVGLLPSTSGLVAGSLVEALRETYPRLRLRIIIGYAGHLQQWLDEGEVDVALLYGPRPSSLLEIQPMLDEKLYLVGLPESNMQAGVPVRLRDLAKIPLILPNRPHGLRALLDQAALEAGVELAIVAETNAMSIQKELVMRRLGYTVLPSSAISYDVGRGLLSASPITEPDLQRRLVLALSMTRQAPVAVRCVTGELRRIIRGLVAREEWPGAKWAGEEAAVVV